MKSLLLLIAIPVFGFGVSQWVLWDINKALDEQGVEMSIAQLCSAESLAQNPELTGMCAEIKPVLWMQWASIGTAVAAVLLLLSFIVFASAAGQDRVKIARLFPPLVFVTLITLSVLVLIQGVVLTYGTYLAEAQAIGRVHIYLILAVGLGALVACYGLATASIQLMKKQSSGVLGTQLERGDHPRLFAMVESVADKLGARKPDNVVVGLEPNFYVTSADVKIAGTDTTLSGATLYLSLPLARILTGDEIKGIIGHELGHFRGDDTYFSLKFSPVYAGLSHALSTMENQEPGLDMLGRLPAQSVLSYIMDVFHTNVSTISREREFEADKAAAEVAPAAALASSLLKIGLYASAWGDLERRVVERLQNGRTIRNMSTLFASVVRYDVDESSIPEVVSTIAQDVIAHPTDSHPPTANRIEALGLNIDDVDNDLLVMPQNASIDLFENAAGIEEQLTVLQQQYYLALGVQMPEEEQYDTGAVVLAALGAHMVLADGVIEAEEVDQAESIGSSLTEAFDFVDFREYCHHPDSIPAVDDLLNAAAGMSDEGKALVIDYLEKIAGADNDVCEQEQALLDKVKAAFQA